MTEEEREIYESLILFIFDIQTFDGCHWLAMDRNCSFFVFKQQPIIVNHKEWLSLNSYGTYSEYERGVDQNKGRELRRRYADLTGMVLNWKKSLVKIN